jgi:hypothetical protein
MRQRDIIDIPFDKVKEYYTIREISYELDENDSVIRHAIQAYRINNDNSGKIWRIQRRSVLRLIKCMELRDRINIPQKAIGMMSTRQINEILNGLK